MPVSTLPPFRPNPWEPAKAVVSPLENGNILVESGYPCQPVHANLVAMFHEASERYPERIFMARRNADDSAWDQLSYAKADEQSDAIAQWLLDQGLAPGTAIMVLSENSLEHALLMLAGYKSRLPLAPVSPNYSLLSKDCGKIKSIFDKVKPGVVFVQSLALYQRALNALPLTDAKVVYVDGKSECRNYVPFSALLNTQVTSQVHHVIQQLQPCDAAKILFTSGSTGEPKGVVNTHHALCYTQAALTTVVHVDESENPPIMLDWMPWHHTYGGNQNIHRVMHNAGTLYIDDGKPVPGLFTKTLANLKRVNINSYSTVPAVYALLLDAMEQDEELRTQFFQHLEWCSYGGSDMPQSTFDRFQKMAIEQTGQRITMINALGSTESAAIMTFVHWSTEQMGSIGLPIPGTQVKLAPVGEKFELRIKGPQMCNGYLGDPEKTKQSFDDEGFLCTGDAVKWIDEQTPEKGLRFAGRVSEDFKLLNGTWVHTSALRVSLLSALTPLVSDAVITGQDKEYLGAMVWLNEAAVTKLLGVPIQELAENADVIGLLKQKIGDYNGAHAGASTRISRMLILTTPPDPDAGEISDKRYINQRAVLEKRASDVALLYQSAPHQRVILCPSGPASTQL